jgi:hypothetical protein
MVSDTTQKGALHTMKDWSTVPIPKSYAELHENYGDPASPTFESDYIVENSHLLADGSTVHVRSHIAMVPALHVIFGSVQQYIKTYDGCYVVRDVRGSDTTLSLHSWGLAIDLNAADNPLGGTSHQPEELIETFKAHGFWWGGDFHTRKDPMHFQRAGDI